MDSREEIFGKLIRHKVPIKSKEMLLNYRPVIPDISDDRKEMVSRFSAEAERLNCIIHPATDKKHAVEAILALVNGEKKISGWDFDQIGLPGLEEVLEKRNIHLDTSSNPATRYGVTGVEAALAATGSLVLASGKGKNRAASLLPLIHIAVVHSRQIVKDLETWLSFKRETGDNFLEASNITIISGPSKTADIAMELVLGMHGPQEMHIILIEEEWEHF